MVDERTPSPQVVVWLPISGRETPDSLVEVDHDGNPAGELRFYRAPTTPTAPATDRLGLIDDQSACDPD